MDHDDLVSTFGETVGVEKAQSLLEDTLDDLGLEQAKSYSSHEVADICETIARDTDGYLEIVATEIRVRERAQRRFDALIEEPPIPSWRSRFTSRPRSSPDTIRRSRRRSGTARTQSGGRCRR
ncbi:hypothetical protein D8S78_18635 [Natrialba swarupiae]|nr:hypothetical protein [Natrialba swarupiae]